MFEVLEHPADVGFRATGRSLAELFENAALALVSIASDLDTVVARQEYSLAARGDDAELLLVNWLSEVLYWFDGERIAFRRFQVNEIDSYHVRAVGFGEPRNAQRHPAKLIIKAVTYHQLEIRQTPDGWSAQVFLDV